MTSTPVSLLDRLRDAHDRAAWERFVELFAPLLYTWARRAGASDADAADLVQDVLVTLVRRLPDFRRAGPGSFRGFLQTVLRNRWRDRLKKRSPALTGDADDHADPTLSDPAEAMAADDFRDHLYRRVLALIQRDYEPATWRAFWAVVVAGRPAVEVAAELGLTPNAVYLARGRILRRLREELADLVD